jgi:hypothetical protein
MVEKYTRVITCLNEPSRKLEVDPGLVGYRDTLCRQGRQYTSGIRYQDNEKIRTGYEIDIRWRLKISGSQNDVKQPLQSYNRCYPYNLTWDIGPR